MERYVCLPIFLSDLSFQTTLFHLVYCIYLIFQNTHPLEATCEVKLALHHVKEDGDGGLSQLDLGNKGHLQNWTHHLRDELYLVGALKIKQVEEKGFCDI